MLPEQLQNYAECMRDGFHILGSFKEPPINPKNGDCYRNSESSEIFIYIDLNWLEFSEPHFEKHSEDTLSNINNFVKYFS